MSFRMVHENYNVSDLDRSIKFYGDALDLHEVRRKTTDAFCMLLNNLASNIRSHSLVVGSTKFCC